MGHITYYKHDDRWFRREWKPQCKKRLLLITCQGTEEHSGEHWAYNPNGSLEISSADGGLSIIPPGNKGWISPVKMQNKYHLKFSTMTEVKDKRTIQMLEKDSTPEKDVSIDKPVEL